MGRKLRIDMTGLRFGRLVCMAFSHRAPCGHAHWHFECDCGVEIVTNGANVRSGNTASCGCLHREISAARLTVHGHRAARRHDASYRAWQGMNDSCANPRSPNYAACGACGIAVCDRWREDYAAFLQDMGERPADAVLARHDPSDDFGPGNCRWVAVASRSARAASGWRRRGVFPVDERASLPV